MELEFLCGTTIEAAIDEAITAAKPDEQATFVFNQQPFCVAVDSDPKLLLRDFHRGFLRTGDRPTIGPYPSAVLSEEKLAEDARLQREQKERQAKRQAEYEAKRNKAELLLEGALSVAPELSLADADGWNKYREANRGGYGGACVRFAENWGRLMQARIEQGEALADIADECSTVADGPEGITGFMYGCAVQMLSQCWKHGEELRRWHNLDAQLSDEGEKANESGGVLNPAMLRVGGPE